MATVFAPMAPGDILARVSLGGGRDPARGA